MQFQREKASSDLFGEMLPLLQQHYQEIAHHKDIPLEPDFEKYEHLEKAGVIRIYTARLETELVGYCAFFVLPHIHYKSCVFANQDVVFIEKSRRGLGAGKAFIDWCDGELKSEGVHVVSHHVKAAHSFGPMLVSLGYELVDLIYSRRLN